MSPSLGLVRMGLFPVLVGTVFRGGPSTWAVERMSRKKKIWKKKFPDMRSTAHVDGPPMETDPTKTGKSPIRTKSRLGDILNVLISKKSQS